MTKLTIPEYQGLDAIRLGAALTESFPGGRLEVLESCPSTQALAVERARAGEAFPLAVFAEAQSAGRGRLGRSWASPSRRNLYVSMLLRPQAPLEQLSGLTLGVSLAVADALDGVGLRAGIKWPNDLLVSGRKISGILTELLTDTGSGPAFVVGIGVNLNATTDEFPLELRQIATSVAIETGKEIDRSEFAAALLGALSRRWRTLEAAGFAAMRAEWEGRHVLTGRVVSISAGAAIEGVVRGVADDGALLVEGTHGLQRVLSGEATLAPRRE